MDKLSKEKLEAIVKKSMPDYKMVEPQPVAVDGPLPSQMRGAGLKKIQQKLASLVEPYHAPEDVVVTDRKEEDVVQAVEVAPRSGRFAKERKTVLVSAAKKQIVGRQG